MYEALIGIGFIVLVIYLGIKCGYGEERDTDSNRDKGQQKHKRTTRKH